MAEHAGFVPPPYPYDRLNRLKPVADAFAGGVVDLSIGTPFDPPPPAVVAALGSSGSERSYPPSMGTPQLRTAAHDWIARRFDVDVPIDQIAAAVGTKEFVATLPQWMRLRTPGRDTVLFPAVSYPTYAMGATLAGCRPVAVPMGDDGTLDLESIDEQDAERALLLWVNSPSNPTGALDDLGAAAGWGRAHGVPVFSDECYVEFTWDGPGRTILEHGLDGVIAVHSLSKRSNFAGGRTGVYAGDADIVAYLRSVRQHAGLMVPGPAQAAAAVAFDDDEHVEVQRGRYRARLELMAGVLSRWSGIDVPLPSGAFYLWIPVADGWEFTERLAAAGGALVSPGEFYGPDGAPFVRVAVVQPDDRIELVASAVGGDELNEHGASMTARTTSARTGVLAIGIVVVLVGLLAAAGLWYSAGERYDDAVRNLARAPVGCITTLDFAETGDYFVFVETRGTLDIVVGDCGAVGDFEWPATTAPSPDLALVDPRGDAVELDPSTEVSYDAGGSTGRSVERFRVDTAGDHLLTVADDESGFAIAVGRDPNDGVGALRLGAAFAAIAGLVVGGGLLVIATRRRPEPGGQPPVWPGSTWVTTPPGMPVQPAPPPGSPPTGPPTSPPPGPPTGPPPGPPPGAAGIAGQPSLPGWTPGPPSTARPQPPGAPTDGPPSVPPVTRPPSDGSTGDGERSPWAPPDDR